MNGWPKNGKHSKKKNDEVSLNRLPDFGKLPPSAPDLEEAVIGACLIEGNAIHEISMLRPEHFYVDSHSRMYNAILKIHGRGQALDTLTLVEELKKSKELDLVGGPFAVTRVTNAVVSTANIDAWAQIILQKYLSRELIKLSVDTYKKAYDNENAFDTVDHLEMVITKMIRSLEVGGFRHSSDFMMEVIERLSHARVNQGVVTGVPSHIRPLDRLTNGWQPTDFIILAARPSVGKTAFALNLALNAASSTQKQTGVGFFSLEMSGSQLIQRLIAAHGDIDLSKISKGDLDDREFDNVASVTEDIGNLPLYIDDTAALTTMEFKSRARRMVRNHNVGLIIIDYLQLMKGDGDFKTNREQEISTISRTLKQVAKELKVPIIALSQLSRASEKEGREPQLSDLRESGAIEQDADIVMFLTRPSYQQDEKDLNPDIMHDVTAFVRKHRNGNLGKLDLKVILSVQKFFDLYSYDQYQNNKYYF